MYHDQRVMNENSGWRSSKFLILMVLYMILMRKFLGLVLPKEKAKWSSSEYSRDRAVRSIYFTPSTLTLDMPYRPR